MQTSIEAFVIMPFAKEMRDNYDLIIRPALARANVHAIRADEEHAGYIHGQMFARILDSHIVIADVSGTNPNVFYELGVSHALRGRTLMVVRADCTKTIPFDVMPYRIFVFEDPRSATPETIESDVAKLAAEISRLTADPALSVPNPVQDFLISRSAVTSPRSAYLAELTSPDQERALATAKHEIAYVGLSCASCAKPVLETIEAGLHPLPLHLRIGMLDPACIDGWRFLYNLREAHPAAPGELEEFRAETTESQNGWIKKLDRLAKRNPHFSHKISLIPIPFHFWAFMIDQERIFLGYFALNRETATGMPVTLLVKSDPATRRQFDYYHATIESLLT